ncbi:MAG TPA: plastocyanin/azurin family copper-binding protein [Longimicrobium sp.]|nr:plastocyanin/azurin family copper-binding protein [Longimicrobium sp.]
MKILSRRLLPFFAAALALAACDGGGGGSTQPQTGRVAGSVTAGGAGVQGASVAMTGGGTATTSATGQFAMENVAVGNRTLTLAVPNGFTLAAGQTAAKSVAVAAGQTASVSWQLMQTPQTGRIEGSVTAGGTGVQGVSIALTGGATATTNAAGAFALENVPVGNRTLTLTVPNGFTLAAGQTAAKQVTVAAGQTANVTWQLTQTPQTGRIEGSVTAGGAGVQGASIALAGGGNAATNAAGAFAFENVAVGNRTLTLTVPNGYTLAAGQTAAKQVAVAAGQTANVTWQLTHNPAPTVVEIHLTAGLQFAPSQVTIAPGTTVRWINDAAMLHTITPLNPNQAGAWPSQQLDNAGQTYEFTFTTAGTYDYRCNPHAGLGMTGSITVQ